MSEYKRANSGGQQTLCIWIASIQAEGGRREIKGGEITGGRGRERRREGEKGEKEGRREGEKGEGRGEIGEEKGRGEEERRAQQLLKKN